eukprot:CAMPEP_0171091660 /NCGR_PEP_ID=MMETSP0766_2-20121228/34693_1 /TAXON_ID=439317 /ORGANISM="Gambierdiscus australes, Strain CAWD 149" /LENGTH=140 /DNA_ID=CAMNT_0011549803 /DNA_START=52 /DNA_END=474 /DNA_ORIENTATION=+
MSAIKGKVLKAAGLKNVDLWGKSDPFVRVSLETPSGDMVGESKTSTKTDDLNPVWEDEPFNFAHPGDDFLDMMIRFKVMDTGLGPDVELGEALVPVKLVPQMGEDQCPTPFTFSLGIKHKKSMGTLDVLVGIVPAPSFFG